VAKDVNEDILVALSVNCITRNAVRVKFTGFCPLSPATLI